MSIFTKIKAQKGGNFKRFTLKEWKMSKKHPKKGWIVPKKHPSQFSEKITLITEKKYERIHPFKSSFLAIFTKIKPQKGENLKRFNLKERTMSTNHPKKGWIVPKKNNPCKFSNKITPITKKNWKKPLQEYFFVHFHQNKIPTGWKF